MNLVGRKLGKYEVVEQIGKGGMAQVYKAFQPGVERFVAVKVMHKYLAEDDSFVARFRHEAKAIGRMRHQQIVGLIDFDIEDDQYYIVMNYIKGDTLRTYLKKNGPLPSVQALRIVAQLAQALGYAHQHGIIHRDIKPSNIMFVDDSLSRPVLTDFGIARLAGHKNTTVSDSIMGTPAYMSPEALQNDNETIDERSDLYSLGVVLYQMVVGATPYSAETPYGMILKRLNDPLPLPCQRNPHIPKEVEQLILKALAKKPKKRFQSAEEFHHAIQQTLFILTGEQLAPSISLNASSGSTKTARRTVSPAKRQATRRIVASAKQQASKSRRHLFTLLGASGGAFACAALTLMLFFGSGSPSAPSEAEFIANLDATATAITVPTATVIPRPTIAPTKIVTSNSTTESTEVTDPNQLSPPTAQTEVTEPNQSITPSDSNHAEENENSPDKLEETNLANEDEQSSNNDKQSSDNGGISNDNRGISSDNGQWNHNNTIPNDNSEWNDKDTIPNDNGEWSDNNTIPNDNGEWNDNNTIPNDNGEWSDKDTIPNDHGEWSDNNTIPNDHGEWKNNDEKLPKIINTSGQFGKAPNEPVEAAPLGDGSNRHQRHGNRAQGRRHRGGPHHAKPQP